MKNSGDWLKFWLVRDAGPMLHSLAAETPRNQSPAEADAPLGDEPSLRLADRGVEAFASALPLTVEFELNKTRRYSADERDRLRSLINTALPQRI